MSMENGTYRARAQKWDLGLTESMKEQVWIEFKILAPDSHLGETINYYGYFTEKTWARTVESLRICGWTGIDVARLDGLDGNEVDLVVANEEYPEGSGQWSPRVKWVNRVGSGGGLKKAMTEEEKIYFAQVMKGKILQYDQDASSRTRRVGGRQVGPQDDRPPPTDRDAPAPKGSRDDIPF